MKFNLPKQVEFALDLLTFNGFEAYCVGGCVRDMVMGKTPLDYDITTSATPTEVKDVFESLKFKVIETGIKHGTVTVIIEDLQIEVTTYRIDGEYKNNRHPDNVIFSTSLKEDLKRRDFTFNALAYNKKDGLVDYFGGLSDIGNQLIRCIGNPDDRFTEDALRILRGVRFTCVLGFKLEEKTATSLHKHRKLLNNISKERIRTEWTKIICGEYLDLYIVQLIDVICVIFPHINYLPNKDTFTTLLHLLNYVENAKTTFHNITLLSPIIHVKLGAFFIGFHADIGLAKQTLKTLTYPNDVLTKTLEFMELETCEFACDKTVIKQIMSTADVTVLFDYLNYQVTIGTPDFDHYLEIANAVIACDECFKREQLKVNGDDLKSLGITEGKQIGELLERLLKAVIADNSLNNKENLLALVEQ